MLKGNQILNPEAEYLHMIGRESGLSKLTTHIDQL